MGSYHEQRLNDVRQALNKLHGSDDEWHRSIELFEQSRLPLTWRTKALHRLIDAGYLERSGARDQTQYRVPKGRNISDLFDPVSLSSVLWPNDGYGIPSQSTTEEEDEEDEEEEDSKAEVEAPPEAPEAPESAPRDLELLVTIAEGLSSLSQLVAHVVTKVGALEAKQPEGSADDLLLEVATKLETKIGILDKSLGILDKSLGFFDKKQLSESIASAVALSIASASTESVAPAIASAINTSIAPAITAAVASEMEKLRKNNADALVALGAKIDALAGPLNKRQSELEAKIDDVSSLLDKRQVELGHAFKALVDAIGDHRKIDDHAREKTLSTIMQALTLNAKQISEEVNKGRMASKFSKVETSIEGLGKKLDSLATSNEVFGEATERMLVLYSDLGKTMAALIAVLKPEDLISMRRPASSLALIANSTTAPTGKKAP